MKNINQHSTLTATTVMLFLVVSPMTVAQTDTDDVESRPLFENHEMLTVRIEAPMTTLLREKPEDEYLDGTFSFTGPDGQEHSLDLKLQTRGRYRRQRSTCNFPPIRLNFRKKQVKGTEFAGQDKLKLITHCQTRRKNFEQLVMREFLAYRIFQTMTDKSFGARMLQITYVDTEKDGKSMTKYGFVIEDEDDIGERLGLTASKLNGIKARQLDARQANLVSVYEYLIGNTDFSLILGPADSSCCHNAVLFSNGGAPFTPIPYDFDFSGLVDAPYAEPNPRFKLRSVKTRRYRGRCINNELLDDTFALFLGREAEIRSHVTDLAPLDDKNRQQVTKYLNAFFEDISNPKSKERKFIKNCS